jgi:gluconate 5-dehydrogenase
MLDQFSLKDRVALVTGSSRGLGWAIAEALSGAGAHIVLNGRDRSRLEKPMRELEAQKRPCTAVPFDVTETGAIQAGMAEIERTLGRLDILVNNAGIVLRNLAVDTTDAAWQEVIDTDLTACFKLSREAAKIMLKRNWGRIINISSVMGTFARPTIASYISSKHGIHGLTKALAVELGPKGINVNCIGPGFFPTEPNAVVRSNKTFYDWVSNRSPLGRWGDPKELGGAAIYFASDASSFCNGQVLTIDGGMTIAM